VARLRRYAELRRWRRTKALERTAVAAAAAEEARTDKGLRRQKAATRARERWREAEWRHIMKVAGLLRDGRTRGARREAAAERRYQDKIWDHLEGGWAA